jgi:rhodanese-related sulfurtransferase
MKLLIKQGWWGALLLLLVATPGFSAMTRNLDATKARDLVATEKQLYILDVRTPQEFAQVRLADAQLIPIDSLLKRIGELPKDRPILVYCAVGQRSSQVSSYLTQAGYPDIYNLTGGIWGWELRGYPVIKGLP